MSSPQNSEITWLVYPFARQGPGQPYTMGCPEVVYSAWDDVQDALREGEPPEPGEIMADIAARTDAVRFSV